MRAETGDVPKPNDPVRDELGNKPLAGKSCRSGLGAESSIGWFCLCEPELYIASTDIKDAEQLAIAHPKDTTIAKANKISLRVTAIGRLWKLMSQFSDFSDGPIIFAGIAQFNRISTKIQNFLIWGEFAQGNSTLVRS